MRESAIVRKKIHVCTNPDGDIRHGTKDSPEKKNSGDPVYRRFAWKLKKHSPETEKKRCSFSHMIASRNELQYE